MIRAGFVSSAPQWHWERQFPGSRPVWDDVEFVFSGGFDNCDIVFVYDAIPDDLSGRLSAPRSMFIASEPASVKTYHHAFLAQFDRGSADLLTKTGEGAAKPFCSHSNTGMNFFQVDRGGLEKPVELPVLLELRPETSHGLAPPYGWVRISECLGRSGSLPALAAR